MFPMAGIQSKVALKLWNENSCSARLQHGALEQARVPWVTIPLQFLAPSVKTNPADFSLSFWFLLSTPTLQTGANQSCPNTHKLPLAFSLTFRKVKLWIPDLLLPFRMQRITLATHTHFSPPTSCQIPLPIPTPEQASYISSCEIIHFFPAPLKS